MITGTARIIVFHFIVLSMLVTARLSPAFSQDGEPAIYERQISGEEQVGKEPAIEDRPVEDEEAAIEEEQIEWEVPGQGVSFLTVNPSDGSLWMFCHQTDNLVALDTSDGSILVDVPMTIHPTAMAFTPDGSIGFLAGEPASDQIYDAGLLQAFDPSDGSIIADFELEGSASAVYVADRGTVYVACGLQYAYQGTIYKLRFAVNQAGGIDFAIDAQAVCGKIPWAIALYDGVLYVTDLELQWALQDDGSMGPPYGSWVWAYNPDDLTSFDKSWVGINPTHLAVTDYGLLVACSGNKLGEGYYMEPALSLIHSPGDSESIYIETSGASGIAVSPDGTRAVVPLANWGPPASNSALSIIQQALPWIGDDLKRWVYTGDIAYITFVDGEPQYEKVTVLLPESFIRAVAISIDGRTVYALNGLSDTILAIPAAPVENR